MTTDTAPESPETDSLSKRTVPETEPQEDDADTDHQQAQQSGEVFAGGQADHL